MASDSWHQHLGHAKSLLKTINITSHQTIVLNHPSFSLPFLLVRAALKYGHFVFTHLVTLEGHSHVLNSQPTLLCLCV